MMDEEMKWEYRNQIAYMIEKIDNVKFLQKIYTLILLHIRKHEV